MMWLLNPPARRAVASNLEVVTGWQGPRLRRLVQRTFREGARSYYSLFRLADMTCADIEILVRLPGWHHLERALDAGKGAILAQPHFCGTLVGSQALPCRGIPFTAPVEPVRPPELLELLTSLRSRCGANLVPLDNRTVGVLLAALRRNEVIGLMSDRDVSGASRVVDLFGRPASLPAGPAVLSLRTGAPVLTGAVIRRPDGGYDGIIEPPIAIQPSGDTETDILAMTRAMARRLEYHIARHPLQWTVFQPIWPAPAPAIVNLAHAQ